MENFWDQRYSEPGFAYGREPNEFFKRELDKLEPGNLLLPGEGEGRNAIYAASKGWIVTAFDQSKVARRKALDWAGGMGLKINYLLFDLNEIECTFTGYDLIALIYIHLPVSLRQPIHQRLVTCLKPGGSLIMECFHKDQLNYGTGGPPVEELLYSENELRKDFSDHIIEMCENIIVYKEEGRYHAGESSIIRLIVKKPPV